MGRRRRAGVPSQHPKDTPKGERTLSREGKLKLPILTLKIRDGLV